MDCVNNKMDLESPRYWTHMDGSLKWKLSTSINRVFHYLKPNLENGLVNFSSGEIWFKSMQQGESLWEQIRTRSLDCRSLDTCYQFTNVRPMRILWYNSSKT